jgi:hypothetical protein
MSVLVDARRATELALLDQIDKFIGWSAAGAMSLAAPHYS